MFSFGRFSLLFTVMSIFAVSAFANQEALMKAVVAGDLARCKQEVINGARLDLEDRQGWTPLGLAIHCNRKEVAKWIINWEENIPSNDTPLTQIERPSSENSQGMSIERKRTTLLSRRKSSKNVIKTPPACPKLSELPSETHSNSSRKVSPRHSFMPFRSRSPSNDNKTKLHSQRPDELETPQNLVMFQREGSNYFHIAVAASISDPSMLELILSAIPSTERSEYLNAADRAGRTPLTLALSLGLPKIAMWLVRHGASIDRLNAGCQSVFRKLHQFYLMERDLNTMLEGQIAEADAVSQVGDLLNVFCLPTMSNNPIFSLTQEADLEESYDDANIFDEEMDYSQIDFDLLIAQLRDLDLNIVSHF